MGRWFSIPWEVNQYSIAVLLDVQLKMEGSFDIPCVGGSLYHWKGTQCIIGREFNIPWVWDSI
jgi:hypothetical protein